MRRIQGATKELLAAIFSDTVSIPEDVVSACSCRRHPQSAGSRTMNHWGVRSIYRRTVPDRDGDDGREQAKNEGRRIGRGCSTDQCDREDLRGSRTGAGHHFIERL